MTPLDYGKRECDALMHQYKAKELPPESCFFYHQGVFLSGMQRIYRLCKEQKYFDYVKEYVDSVINQKGEIIGFCHELTTPETPELAKRALTMLDSRQPGILLFDLLEETGEKKYETAIKMLGKSMYYWPVNAYGGYWHMMTEHNQMWLDGAYMAGPLSAMYAVKYQEPVLLERAIHQIFLMDDHMKDEKTGLYYHGWDASARKQSWADEKTGLSQVFWGRAVGWYAVAVLDILDWLNKDHPASERLKQIERDLLVSLAGFQEEKSGMWCQVLNCPQREENWVESSCTCLFLYSYAKALRKGILDSRYEAVMNRGWQGLINSLVYDEEGFQVMERICVGTCIDSGTYEHYINRKQIRNDLHGAGAFILMCAEMEAYRCQKEKV